MANIWLGHNTTTGSQVNQPTNMHASPGHGMKLHPGMAMAAALASSMCLYHWIEPVGMFIAVAVLPF